MWGFQLWANLPASHKMMQPRYRDIKSQQIPEVVLNSGVKIKVICGQVNGVSGPVQDIITDPQYLDVQVPARTQFIHKVHTGHTVFAYVIDGNGFFEPDATQSMGVENLVIFTDGEEMMVSTQKENVRFLLISGQPIREPIAWYGPIVMNTQEELSTAFEEYQNGTFLKHEVKK
jgi:redox-sensitive bicupin YhaK (pirin superfamily)